ncbi:hypothetical protein F5Y00DRAFT_264297 [Daldinia vernicosa]|uniref:uncharacterized protein n=1 Tax=Daldinia vernicosa TaxID=114800 RepID=UPI002008A7BF|nr:uncharacterized protein F5Y00DRAFT_264297 [Daldinia vernicosa]KAI0846682.1 hypothetical protein F5Y00DRAFT_264297 [Daldinia vernicosa]
MSSQSSNQPGLYEAQPATQFPQQTDNLNGTVSRMHTQTLLNSNHPLPDFELEDHHTADTMHNPNRRRCACTQCECPNLARKPMVYINGSRISVEPQPAFCLRCEKLQLWGKNEPSYKACKCECRCRLQREDGELQCGDCLGANQENRNRHRPHGKA